MLFYHVVWFFCNANHDNLFITSIAIEQPYYLLFFVFCNVKYSINYSYYYNLINICSIINFNSYLLVYQTLDLVYYFISNQKIVSNNNGSEDPTVNLLGINWCLVFVVVALLQTLLAMLQVLRAQSSRRSNCFVI